MCQIRFDVPFGLLTPRRGEVEIDTINAVEDTKGNNGEKGQLSVTNLRIIWCSHKDPRTNLSQPQAQDEQIQPGRLQLAPIPGSSLVDLLVEAVADHPPCLIFAQVSV